MKINNVLLALVLTMIGTVTLAQEVSVETAKGRAVDFLTSEAQCAMRAKGRMVKDLQLAYTSRSEEKTCFYVFNVGEDDGFVIAGGDASAHEILGYCDHGTFDYESAPENFKWWLSQYEERIANAEVPIDTTEDVNTSSKARRRAKATTERESIGPLIQTKWNQGYPYNSEIPVYSSDSVRYVTGCVATAMAQVMKYWEHPKQGNGNYSYTLEGNTFSANFGETTYDWDNMLLKYSSGYTEEEAKAVGTLMYHVGVASSMNYSTTGSGTVYTHADLSLVNYFNYDKSIRLDDRDYYTDDEWEEMVYNELANGRPVLYSGVSLATTAAGHAFICDGYDSESEMFTINWGWGGLYDGSYLLTGDNALSPRAGSVYNYSHQIMANVQPAGMGTNEEFVNVCTGQPSFHQGDNSLGSEYSYDRYDGRLSDLYLNSYFLNLSCLTTEFDLGLKVTEVVTNETQYLTCYNNVTILQHDKAEFNLYFDPYDLPSGTYEIVPVVRKSGESDDSWKEPKHLSITYPVLTVTSPDDTPVSPYLYNGLYYNMDQSTKTAEVCPSCSDTVVYSGDIIIPDTVGYYGYRITAIAPCAFQDCTEVTSVTMGDNVTQIGYSAFERCKGMKSVTLGKNVVKLSYEAFKDCTSLSSVLLGSKVTTIGDRAFYRCTSLRVLNIPKGVTYLGNNFIAEAPLLGLIAEKSTPMTLTTAMLEGFDPSTCMLSVPEGSQSAYESASGWSGFQFVNENECTGQQDLILTKYCAHSIFYALYADSTLIVSGSGEMVGDDEFAVDYFPTYCRKVIIEEPILTVGEEAFRLNKEYLTTAIIGDSVYYIEDASFMGCKALTSVTIGKGLLSIGDRAFRNCTSLASITVLATEPPSRDDDTFSNVDKDNCVVWVPFGCKSKYEAASGWSEFNDIRELEAELTMLGDANYDGKVRIGDATAILNYIVGFEVEGFNEKNADVNQDGKIRIGDVTGVLNIIVGGTLPPPSL